MTRVSDGVQKGEKEYVQKHALQKYKQVNGDSCDLVAKWFWKKAVILSRERNHLFIYSFQTL